MVRQSLHAVDGQPRIGAAEGQVVVQCRALRRSGLAGQGHLARGSDPACLRGIAGETRFTQPLFQEVKPVDGPIPFAFEMEHGAEIVTKLRADRVSFLGSIRNTGVRILKTVSAGQDHGIAFRQCLQARELRGRGGRWRCHRVGMDLDVVPARQWPEQLGG